MGIWKAVPPAVLAAAMLVPTPASPAQYWDYEADDGPGYDWYEDRYDYTYDADPGGYERYPGRRAAADRQLKQDVESQLAWSPFVDADRIDVSVKDGTVTLRGTVEDRSAVEDAIENAFDAGAVEVISKLKTQEDE
ncbi:BON domain-containing protein [Nitrospira moscoviensis]|uniref:BON domain-containing protein n=1 Tax=Nitrospira moscoviensis TaxID=42253 RepID=A0A0K2GDY7_NITMO|nr:BON domain-containing protein [Nitrospira moscoviensis]ALA59166.1 hypothetical protein NITMOv2_2756 [Nitrospira moscoviensis]